MSEYVCNSLFEYSCFSEVVINQHVCLRGVDCMDTFFSETLIGCRKTKIHIPCDKGQVIKVKSADFSKQFKQCAKRTEDLPPCSNDVTETVAELCDDLQTCRFRAKARILGKGDCGPKVDLEVTYVCETKGLWIFNTSVITAD